MDAYGVLLYKASCLYLDREKGIGVGEAMGSPFPVSIWMNRRASHDEMTLLFLQVFILQDMIESMCHFSGCIPYAFSATPSVKMGDSN